MEIYREDGEVEHRPKSAGGTAFDIFTYGIVNVLGTFVLTVPLANLFLEGGRFHHLDGKIRSGLEKVLPSIGKLNKKAFAEGTANALHFGWGGIAMVIPVMTLEHFRTPLVIWLNRKLGDNTSPESIKDAPPQTIGAAVEARLLAFGAAFTFFNSINATLGVENFMSAMDKAGKWLCKVTKQPVEIVKDGKKTFSMTYRIGKSGAIDTATTLAAASIFYFGSHAFSNQAYRKRMTRLHGNAPTPSADEIETPLDDTKPGATVSAVKREEQNLATAPALEPVPAVSV